MSEQEFDAYLRLLGRFLHLSEAQREAISQELREHMEDRLAELLERGCTREEAIDLALNEFGDAAALAADFGRVGRRKRWIMRTSAATVGIAATILFVSFLLPENRSYVPSPALSLAEQQSSARAATRPATEKAAAPRVRSFVVRGESDEERATQQRLARVLPTVEFAEGASFEEVIHFLAEVGGISIDVNWNALELVGIDKLADTHGLRLRDVRLDRALQMVLENFGGAVGAELGYSVVDGIVRVSTLDELDRRLIVRVYDCRSLVASSNDREAKPAGPGMMGGGGMGGGEMMPGGIGFGGGRVALPQELLVDLIRETIAPGSWGSQPGSGSIGQYDELLVVRHTWRVHQAIRELLELIQEARAARDEPGSAGVALEGHRGMFSRAAAEQLVSAGPRGAHAATRPNDH